jgi:hypothetical protein
MADETLLEWLTRTKFAGYNKFQQLPDSGSIRCISGLLDGTGDHWLGAAYAERAWKNNWTWEQAEANKNKTNK